MNFSCFQPNSYRLTALLAGVILLGLALINNNFDRGEILRRWRKWRDRSYRGYLGATKKQACFIPRLTPGDRSLRHLDWVSALRTMPPKCYKAQLLFTVDLKTKLRKNENHPLSKLATECYFEPVERDYRKPEFQYLNTSTLYKITSKSVQLPPSVQTLYLWCLDSIRNDTIYEDYLTAVQPKAELEAELKKREPQGEKLWSLLMLSQDACSHMNFRRYQPRVHDYLLNEMGAIEFHGFNSLGAGTFKNMFPFLTGLPYHVYLRQCRSNGNFHNESCPYIWKDFAARGYRTGFSEESLRLLGSFKNNVYRGLTKPSFGFDFREVSQLLEIRNLTGHEQHFDSHFCHGSRMRVETILDQALKMATTFAQKPYWFLVWASSLTHFANPMAMYVEEPLLYTLKHTHENQLLKNTILVLVSDHGFTRENFRRSSRQGFLEDRLPMLYVVLPKAFRQRYPLASENMEGNVQRLTTMYDLHATLKHLLHPETLEDAAVEDMSRNSSSKGNKSVSLFLPISPNRTCGTIPFEDGYCICLDRRALSPKEGIARAAATSALKEINARLISYKQCSQLHLTNITQAFKVKSQQYSTDIDLDLFGTPKNISKQLGEGIEVEIETQPGGGAFFCSVSAFLDAKHNLVHRINILRVNNYGSAGDCAPSKELQPLCFCKH